MTVQCADDLEAMARGVSRINGLGLRRALDTNKKLINSLADGWVVVSFDVPGCTIPRWKCFPPDDSAHYSLVCVINDTPF